MYPLEGGEGESGRKKGNVSMRPSLIFDYIHVTVIIMLIDDFRAMASFSRRRKSV